MKKATLSYHCDFIYVYKFIFMSGVWGVIRAYTVYTKKKLVLNYLHVTMASFNHMIRIAEPTIRLKIDLLNTNIIPV